MTHSGASSLAGTRLLVVGASVSVGEAVTLEAARRGANVVAAARRVDLLEQVAARAAEGEGGGDVHAVGCDVLEPEACSRVVDEAATILGGLDWVVYTPAIFPLRELAEMTAVEWQRLFALNVTGAAMVTTAALPHLTRSRGKVMWFTSVSSTSDPHWPGLASYAVSKTALVKLAQCWRYECPEVGFSVMQLGQSEGSDGPNQSGWTAEQTDRFYRQWLVPERLTDRPQLQSLDVVADAVLSALSSPSVIEHITVTPRRAPSSGVHR